MFSYPIAKLNQIKTAASLVGYMKRQEQKALSFLFTILILSIRKNVYKLMVLILHFYLLTPILFTSTCIHITYECMRHFFKPSVVTV